MTIQHFYTAPSATSAPFFSQDGQWGAGKAPQLRRLLWHSPAGMMIGVWCRNSRNYQLRHQLYGTTHRYTLTKIWRNGKAIQFASDVSMKGFGYTVLADSLVTITTDSTVVRGNPPGDYSWIVTSAASGDFYYAIDTIWPGDWIMPGSIAPVSYMNITSVGYIETGTSAHSATGYCLTPTSQGGPYSKDWNVYKRTELVNTPVFMTPGSAYSGALGAPASWGHPRDLIYIDGSTAAITFMQESASPSVETGEHDDDKPAKIRVFDTASSTDFFGLSNWTLKWTDTLPGDDSLACWDPINRILYTANRRQASCVLHACFLARTPTSMSPITIVDDSLSALQVLCATAVSVTVYDGLGSFIPNTLVQWTLDSAASQGELASAYSYTNDSGAASITYIGPVSAVSLSETINAATATVNAAGTPI